MLSDIKHVPEFFEPWSGPTDISIQPLLNGAVSCEVVPAMPGFNHLLIPPIIPFFSTLHMPAMLVNHEGISRVTKSIPTDATARLTLKEPVYRFESCKSPHSTTKCRSLRRKQREKNAKNQRKTTTISNREQRDPSSRYPPSTRVRMSWVTH